MARQSSAVSRRGIRELDPYGLLGLRNSQSFGLLRAFLAPCGPAFVRPGLCGAFQGIAQPGQFCSRQQPLDGLLRISPDVPTGVAAVRTRANALRPTEHPREQRHRAVRSDGGLSHTSMEPRHLLLTDIPQLAVAQRREDMQLQGSFGFSDRAGLVVWACMLGQVTVGEGFKVRRGLCGVALGGRVLAIADQAQQPNGLAPCAFRSPRAAAVAPDRQDALMTRNDRQCHYRGFGAFGGACRVPTLLIARPRYRKVVGSNPAAPTSKFNGLPGVPGRFVWGRIT